MGRLHNKVTQNFLRCWFKCTRFSTTSLDPSFVRGGGLNRNCIGTHSKRLIWYDAQSRKLRFTSDSIEQMHNSPLLVFFISLSTTLFHSQKAWMLNGIAETEKKNHDVIFCGISWLWIVSECKKKEECGSNKLWCGIRPFSNEMKKWIKSKMQRKRENVVRNNFKENAVCWRWK